MDVPVASAVVLVVDRLGAVHLGPWGNTWLETPHFNRLAAQALVCETAFADAPDLNSALRALWTGRHAWEPPAEKGYSLAARARDHGVKTLLITDDRSVTEHPLAEAFDEHLFVESPAAVRSAPRIEQTGFFRLIAAATEAIGERGGPFLAWIHSRGMSGPWDAPREYRERLADPEDPQPPDFVASPERRLERGFDPDEVLGVVQAYVGQVQLVDESLGLLLDALEQRPDRNEILLGVTSPRGYPLGEHGRIGPCDDALYSELVHIPLVIRFPRDICRLARTHRLVQTCDLAPTILEACGWGECNNAGFATSLTRELQGENEWSPRSMVCAAGTNQRVIRTPAWLLRETLGEEEPHRELFAKPDDRWEANEVSSRCDEVTALLAAELDRFEQAARAGELSTLAPPPEVLLDVWR
jgi:arylsulfatase A-like enzyme